MHVDFIGSTFEQGIPRALAGFLLAALPYVHQLFEGRRTKLSFTALPEGRAPFQDYTLSWPLVLVYGAFFAYAASGLGTFIVWLAGLVSGIFLTPLVGLLNLIFLLLAFYLVGSWVGARVDQRPVVAVLGVVLLYYLMTITVTLLGGSQPTYLLLVGGFFISLPAVLFGVRRGRKSRWSWYMLYLLHSLPVEKRPLAVDRFYDHVNSLAVPGVTVEEAQAPEEEVNYTARN